MTLLEPPFSNPSKPPETGLNPRYTFANFIIGSNNKLAHAAAWTVAEQPGKGYNPLFLAGGTGTGKTHLLHAIGHSALEKGQNVLCVSGETFANSALNALANNASEELRAAYGAVDVLLVDDIHFIAGKEAAEEAFFSIFNRLYEHEKQIVASGNRYPKFIPRLDARLCACFEWGLLADIQPPDLKLRTAILRAWANETKRGVPDEVIELIARLVPANAHRLEDCLNHVLIYARLHNLPLSLEVARLALQDELNERYGFE